VENVTRLGSLNLTTMSHVVTKLEVVRSFAGNRS